MLSIFSIPKPLSGFSNIVQRNAIISWLQLNPKCEIILFGDDYGVAEMSEEFNLRHVKSIAKNEFGTPLLGSAFRIAQEIASHDLLMYVNSDIIFAQDTLKSIGSMNIPSFLISGRRWNLEVSYEIDFSDIEWEANILSRVKKDGVLYSHTAMDYFIFPRNNIEMPAFAVGRPGWDVWLVYNQRSKKIPVIDATSVITAIHQNHDYSHSKYGRTRGVSGPEWQRHIELSGGLCNMLTLRDADWVLKKEGLRRPKYPRRIYSLLSLFYPWRVLLAMKRTIVNKYKVI